MNARINLGSNLPDADCDPCVQDFDALLAQSPELAAGWRNLPRRILHPGQALVHAGQPVQQVWRVERGLFRLYYLSAQGQERNRSFHDEGKWIGAGVPPAASSSPYTMEALEPSVAVEVPYAALQRWQARLPAVNAFMHVVLAKIFLRQSQREAELLLLDATARYHAFLDTQRALAERVPLHHVASYLGITNVALSRIRREMKSAGQSPRGN